MNSKASTIRFPVTFLASSPATFMSGFLSDSCVISNQPDHLAIPQTYRACLYLWPSHLSFPLHRMFFSFPDPHMCIAYLIPFFKSLPNSYLPGRSSLTTPLRLQPYFTYFLSLYSCFIFLHSTKYIILQHDFNLCII